LTEARPWTPEDLAALHARCFSAPPPWGAEAFRELLRSDGVYLCALGPGFALGRVVLDEAELLTLAVAPEARRVGHGRSLLAAFEAGAIRRGATAAFLEVAAGNAAACALYAGAGYRQVGRRRGYYGAGGDALVLSRRLGGMNGG
jgi:ribosomal-protein-alanine N-acetyltransferase